MKVGYSGTFKREYKKPPPKARHRFGENLAILLKNQYSPVLNTHPLKGKFHGYYSMNVTGDIRAIYAHRADTFYFVAIGTHSKLYS